jgi:malate permease and related proteins
MAAMLHTLLAALVPLTAIIGLGYGWVGLGRPFDSATLGQLALNVGMPCLALTALASAPVPVTAFCSSAAAALVCLVVLAGAGAAALTLARLRLQTYLPSVTWGNAGFLGVPLALYAFGQSGLGYAVVFSAVSNAFNTVFSQTISAGTARPGVLARTPLIYAIAIGALLQALHLRLPESVERGVSLLGGIAVPLMLMMVGASIARVRARSLPRTVVFSLSRSLGGGMVGFVVAVLFGLSPTARNVLILQCAMPVAVSSYVFAQHWNNDPEEVAALVAVSTWLAALSMPLMLALMIGHSL